MKTSVVTCLVTAGMLIASLVVAQAQSPKPIKDDIPPAALLTERGEALAQRLKFLRQSEANMGSKHPSLPSVREQIAKTKEELKAWAPAANPFDNPSDTGARAVPKMNDEDLRQLVLRLSADVASLKKRVAELERQR